MATNNNIKTYCQFFNNFHERYFCWSLLKNYMDTLTIKLFLAVYWVSQKMSVSNKGAFLTNGHFFDSPCTVYVIQLNIKQ